MTTFEQIWLCGTVAAFVLLSLPFTQVPPNMRWGMAPAWAVFTRVFVISVAWPFSLVVLALMVVSPKFARWVNGE